MNFLINVLASGPQMKVGSRSSVSPMLTEIGTWVFSYVRSFVASFLFVLS